MTAAGGHADVWSPTITDRIDAEALLAAGPRGCGWSLLRGRVDDLDLTAVQHKHLVEVDPMVPRALDILRHRAPVVG